MRNYLLFILCLLYPFNAVAFPTHTQNDQVFHGYVAPLASGQSLGASSAGWNAYVSSLFGLSVNDSSAGNIDTLSTTTRYQVRLTGAITALRGIAGGAAGKELVLVNATGADVTVKNADANPTAVNRILTGTGGDVILPSDSAFRLVYDATTTRWRIAGSGPGVLFNAVAPISYSTSTKDLTCDVASNSQPGCLSSADHTNYSTAFTDTSGATALNTASKIVKRDASGNFAAGAITVGSVNGLTITAPSSDSMLFAPSVSMDFENSLQFLGTNGSSVNFGGGGTIGPLGYAASLSAGLDLACSTRGSILYRGASGWACATPGTSGYVWTSAGAGADPTYQAASTGACSAPVLTKTSGYTILTADFTCASKVLLVELNCSAECTATLPAATNSGFTVKIINVGTATATIATAGGDTFGSNADTTWILPAGGSPQASNTFWANGGSRWNGM